VTSSTSFHRHIRSLAVPFLSRFAQSQGLVTLRQTFVLRGHAWQWPLPGAQENEQLHRFSLEF
jgi:hypothetical protein